MSVNHQAGGSLGTPPVTYWLVFFWVNSNSLTPSKIFFSLGLDANNFPKIIEEYIIKSNYSPAKKDVPIKLRFLQSMSFAPAEIIANARFLRNKLEHYYKNPSNEEVSNSIALAELFILATDNKLKTVWSFSISDEEKHPKNEGHLRDCMYITYEPERHSFEVRAYIGENDYKEISVGNDVILFYYLFGIATSFDYEQDVQDAITDLLEFIGHPMPKKDISIRLI